MKFFGREISIEKIEIDTSGVSSDSPELKKRLDRISDNYDQLNAVLAELELKISQDERLAPPKKKPAELAAIVQTEEEAQDVIHAQQTDPHSVNPKKPR